MEWFFKLSDVEEAFIMEFRNKKLPKLRMFYSALKSLLPIVQADLPPLVDSVGKMSIPDCSKY